MKSEWKLLAIMASVFLIGFFLEETIIPAELNDPQSLDETFEIISELFSVFVALSIFGITWYAYNKSMDNHSLFLGTAFLITGVLILFHLLSYPFMPDFITLNSSHKAAIFFLESRFILAFLLLASVYVYKDSLPKFINKYVLGLFTVAIISVSLIPMFFHEYSLFMVFDLNSYSIATVFLLCVISIFILVAGYIYKKRARDTGQNNLNYFAYGSIIVLFSNLVYFSYELSGHFLIITGFFYFYLAMYRSSVELPYEKLTIAEEKIRKGVENKYRTLFDNANDAIITTDREYLVTSWNRSAVKLFGWEAHEVMGKKLPNLIVPLNSHTGGEEIIRDILDGKSAFGIETENIRKDGSIIFVSLTTSQLLDSNHNLEGLSFIIRDITERKQVENALHASEEKFRTIFEGAAIGMLLFELENQSITVNPAFQRMFGCGPEKVTFELIFDLTHPEDRDYDLKLFNELKEGKRDSYQIEKRYIRKDGILVLGLLTVSLVRGGDNKPRFIISMVEDITERKRLEETLRESEEKYRRIVETSQEGIWMLDPSARTSYINSRMAQIFGFTTKEILGRPVFDFMNSDARIEAEKCLERLKQGIMETLDFRFSKKDGTDLWAIVSTNPIFNDKGQYVGALGMITDITERKQAESALHASEEKFAKAFRSSPQALTITDLNDGRFIEVNDSFTDTLGYSREEAIGHTTLELGIWLTDEDRKKFVGALNEDGFVRNAELDLKTKIGETASMLISAELIDVAGKKCMLSTFYDITKRKLAEEKIKRSLEEKEVLLREIHHRVKNNMQIVSSLLILQSENIEDKKYKDVFIESQNRILSMALIHEKLYQSRNLAQIDFKEYIDGIVSNIFESHGKNGNIRIDNMVENVPIKIDYAIPCGLIINELVTNSLKYAFPERRQGKIQISVKSKDTNMIQISISDDGIGIPKDMDIRNTKSLGLHLVTALAEHQLNGEIILNRERGTEFQINFKGAK